MDNIDHNLNTTQFAAKIWSSFGSIVGFQPGHTQLQQLLDQWWTTKSKNAAHKLLLQATPIFICTIIWQNIFSGKYGGKASNSSIIKYAIYKGI